jgi:hypothetical protein
MKFAQNLRQILGRAGVKHKTSSIHLSKYVSKSLQRSEASAATLSKILIFLEAPLNFPNLFNAL